MNRWAPPLLLLALATVTFADEPKITGELKAKPYTLVRLKAECVDAKSGVLWRVYPALGVDRATTGKGLLEFVAPPGTYEVELLAIGSVDGVTTIAEAKARVVVGDAGPTPPNPVPPTPVPPTPPTPPVDPLAKELAAIYQADTSLTKAAHLELLTELYRQAAKLARSPKTTTLARLAQQVKAAGEEEIPADKLKPLRRKIADFIAVEFGEEDGPMTEELRAKAEATYGRVSAALKAIGGTK